MGPDETWGWLASLLSVLSSLATIGAIGYAGYQIRQASMASSAAASSTTLTAIMASIDRISAEDDDERYHSLVCDLMNTLEFACALYFDRQYAGRTGDLSISLIKQILGNVERNPRLLACTSKAIHDRTTFNNIRDFAKKFTSDWRAIAL